MGGTETIDFDPIVFATPQTISLNSALPELSDTTGTMTIDGPALGVTVARNSAAVTPFIRVFKVDTGVTAAIANVTITGGDVVGEFGGGIYNNGTLSLTECTVLGNSAVNGGGGIFNAGTVTVTASTISGNTSRFGAGVFSMGTVTATNSTISGNSAINNGGGVYSASGLTMYDSTVSANSAGDGGGIYALFPVTLTGTIVAGNVASSDSDINSVPNLGDHDLIGGDPGLAPLGDYGGPTPTMAVLSGSPALGGGVAVSGISTDGRGFTRGSSIDIGAFQASGSLSPQPLVVNVAADSAGFGQFTLRQALNLANARGGNETVTFDPSVFATPKTIALDTALPDLSETTGTLEIVGPASGVTIAGSTASGTAGFRIFTVDAGVTAELSLLTITGGSVAASDSGGGVFNDGTLTLSDCTIEGNSSQNDGGGIENTGIALLQYSTVRGNSAANDGGGIENDTSGELTLDDSTVSGNMAQNDGGGLFNSSFSSLTAVACTLSANSADDGGGLFNGSIFPPQLFTTILAGNSAITGPDYNAGGLSGSSGSNNLFGGDPGLAPLGDYGGPTLTMAILPGSAALGGGLTISDLPTDQRGLPRGNTIDIGAFQASGNSQPLVVNSSSDTAGVGQLNLRQAINLANASRDDDTITFDSNVFATPQTISLNSSLPVISTSMTIDGRPETGIDGSPDVTIDGTQAGSSAKGFSVGASRVIVEGLEVSNLSVGVWIDGPNSTSDVVAQDQIVGNTIGVLVDQGDVV